VLSINRGEFDHILDEHRGIVALIVILILIFLPITFIAGAYAGYNQQMRERLEDDIEVCCIALRYASEPGMEEVAKNAIPNHLLWGTKFPVTKIGIIEIKNLYYIEAYAVLQRTMDNLNMLLRDKYFLTDEEHSFVEEAEQAVRGMRASIADQRNVDFGELKRATEELEEIIINQTCDICY